MRAIHSLILLFPAIAIGCGSPQPPATVYVTVPQAVPSNGIETTAKSADPWEGARKHFEKVKKTEGEKTEGKLKKLDKLTEGLYRHWIEKDIDLASVGTGTETRTFGVILWEAGFTEYITARSEPNLRNARFLGALQKLNPKPNEDEIVTATLRFTVTRSDVRDITLEMIETGRDTHELPQTHKAAIAWTGR